MARKRRRQRLFLRVVGSAATEGLPARFDSSAFGRSMRVSRGQLSGWLSATGLRVQRVRATGLSAAHTRSENPWEERARVATRKSGGRKRIVDWSKALKSSARAQRHEGRGAR